MRLCLGKQVMCIPVVFAMISSLRCLLLQTLNGIRYGEGKPRSFEVVPGLYAIVCKAGVQNSSRKTIRKHAQDCLTLEELGMVISQRLV